MESVEYIQSELTEYYYRNSLLYFAGLITLIVCSVTIFRVLIWTPFKLYFLAQVLPGVDFKKLGRWAIITGGSDGIGKGYAKSLAEKGMDIVLVSLLPDNLNKAAEEIKAEYGVNVKIIVADFTDLDVYDRIRDELEDLDIGALINNVGIGTGSALSTFLQISHIQKAAADVLHVNCLTMTNMCALVLPQMLAKKKGVIVNISSIGHLGFLGSPIYSASKAYVSRLSDCLQRTYKNSGVIIQTIEPGMVITDQYEREYAVGEIPNFLKQAKKYTSTSVEYFTKNAVNTIGWADVTNGCLIHYYIFLIANYGSQKSSDDKLLNAIQH